MHAFRIRSQPPMLAVGSDDASSGSHSAEKVMIYEYSEPNRRWMKVDAVSFMADPVHDIAFAPNIGRSYSVLAIASKELKIVTLKPTGSTRTAGVPVAAIDGTDDQISEKYDVRRSIF